MQRTRDSFFNSNSSQKAGPESEIASTWAVIATHEDWILVVSLLAASKGGSFKPIEAPPAYGPVLLEKERLFQLS